MPGDEAFKLYDTFGMPLDFIQDAARDAGLEFDQAGFDRAMDGTEIARSRLLERRSQANRQSRLPAASEIRIRRLSPDSLRQLRSSRHHPQRPRRAATQARRRRRNHPRPHAVLRRIRRPGRRPRMALQRRSQHRRRRSERLLLPDSRRARAPGHRQTTDPHRRQSRCRRQRRNPRVHHAQPHGHAPAPSRTARSSRQAREAGGIAGRAQPSALRLLALHQRCRRRTARHRRPDQQRSPAQPKDRSHRERPHRCRHQRIQSHGPVRRKIRRPGPRHQNRRLLHRTLRRHAHQRHRRNRPD